MALFLMGYALVNTQNFLNNNIMEKEIITTHDEMVELVKSGHFFNFCIAFALNKGYKRLHELNYGTQTNF